MRREPQKKSMAGSFYSKDLYISFGLWLLKTQILKCSEVKSFLYATKLKDNDLAGVYFVVVFFYKCHFTFGQL